MAQVGLRMQASPEVHEERPRRREALSERVVVDDAYCMLPAASVFACVQVHARVRVARTQTSVPAHAFSRARKQARVLLGYR